MSEKYAMFMKKQKRFVSTVNRNVVEGTNDYITCADIEDAKVISLEGDYEEELKKISEELNVVVTELELRPVNDLAVLSRKLQRNICDLKPILQKLSLNDNQKIESFKVIWNYFSDVLDLEKISIDDYVNVENILKNIKAQNEKNTKKAQVTKLLNGELSDEQLQLFFRDANLLD